MNIGLEKTFSFLFLYSSNLFRGRVSGLFGSRGVGKEGRVEDRTCSPEHAGTGERGGEGDWGVE